MSTIIFNDFKGIRPARSAKLLPEGFGQTANNVYLENGELAPLYSPAIIGALGKTGAINTLYRLGNLWLHWNESVDVARMPIANNALNRVAFTGTDVPRVTDETKAAEGGGVNYPEVSYNLGVPAPDKILVVTPVQDTPQGLQIQWDIAGTVEDGVGNKLARVYTYTFVTGYGEEGPPADPSQIVYAGDDDFVNVTNFAANPIGAYNITRIRIYRSVAATPTAATYLLVAELPFPVTPNPFVDNVLTSYLGEALTSELWDAPPPTMKGISTMANGILAGYVDNDIYFSEPYQGHAWPVDYIRTVDYKVTGIASVGNMLIVTTEGYPYIITGNHPSILTLNKLEQQQACVSTRSIVEMDNGAIYASAEGLVLVSGNKARLITEGVYPLRGWEAFNPTTLHGYFYKNKYIGFHDAGAFQFDLRTGEFTTNDTIANAAFSDMVTGKLHIATLDDNYVNNTLSQFDGDSDNPLTYTWKSKIIETPRTNVEAIRVSAVGYPVDVTLFADADEKTTITFNDDEPHRLPSGYIARNWEILVTSIYNIYSVSLADDVDSLK